MATCVRQPLSEILQPAGGGVRVLVVSVLASWFSRSCFTKGDDKLPKVLLLKYYTYNRGATAQTLSAGGPGLIAPGGTPGKIKWPELGVTELRFRDRLDPADSD